MVTFSKLGDPLWGRLGNQLFQIAGTIGIAQKNEMDFIFPSWEYASYFENSLTFGNCPDCELYEVKGTNYYDIKLNRGNWNLAGFFQSEKFFEQSVKTVRYYFTPSHEVELYIAEKYSDIFANKTCSMHIRRGDYVKQKHHFPVQPLEYFVLAIEEFDADTKFVIFSDDIAWCKNQFKGERFFFIENEKDIIDLFLMSKCDDHIISNSSFSWWGAWLNSSESKKVICPEYWFGPAAKFDSTNFTKDIFASNFQKLKLPKRTLLQKYRPVIGPGIFIYYFVKNVVKNSVKFVLKPLRGK